MACCRAFQTSRDSGSPIRSRSLRSGRFSTISAAAWLNLRPYCCLYLGGWCCLERPDIGLSRRSPFCLCLHGASLCLSWFAPRSNASRQLLATPWTVSVAANVSVFLTLTFLAHQMLISLDAVVRTLVRRIVTRQRLLQWETAAEAEIGGYKRTPLDSYLDWTPALAFGLGLLVWFARPQRSSRCAADPVALGMQQTGVPDG